MQTWKRHTKGLGQSLRYLRALTLPVFLLLLSTGACLCEAPTDIPLTAEPDLGELPAHEVVRVVDGDTVVLMLGGKEEKVRLIGVDTPKTVHPQKPVEAYGKGASRFTTDMLRGESVRLE